MTKLCKFYMKGNCKKGNDCNFLHDPNYKNNKQTNKPNKRNNKKRNTTEFNPSHESPDLRIVPHVKKTKFDIEMSVNDVVVIPNFIDNAYYDKLVEEMEHAKQKHPALWKSWHGDSHFIADDKLKWKEICPIFNEVINNIKNYFNMRVEATRFNMYRTDKEWKPYHHDASAIKKDKAKIQNFTVGLSLGNTREASFQHAKKGTIVNVPLTGGSIYTFARDVNIEWKHGIPQLPPNKQTNNGRLSIILWGHVPQIDGTRSDKVFRY